MSSLLAQRVAQFTEWRRQMVERIDEFRSWMDAYAPADIEQTLRIYDLVETLRSDSIRIAFMGESTAGKVGLANALIFSDLPGGLFPTGPDADFMCATEVFHAPNEAPYVRVLPMDTRKREESFAALRRSPVEWVTMRFDPQSPESVAETMKSLTESRRVSVEEAKALNLWNPTMGSDTEVTVPAWRYALINMPHPMLMSGLAVFYSPGLQLLSAEPEIALRLTSGAQSLMLVLESDLTPAARAVWAQYAQSSPARKFVVLDVPEGGDAGSAGRIAQALDLAPSQVFPIPVQAAVAQRLGHAPVGPQATGIEDIERLHAEDVIPERQTLLLASLSGELAPMVQAARQAVAAKFIATVKEMQDLSSASGKNRNEALATLERLEEERRIYARAVATFNVTHADLQTQGQELLATLHDDRIEEILAHDREFIEGAWTTAGLWKNMQGLFSHFSEQVVKILNYADKLKATVDQIYENFHASFGLAKMSPPPLNLQKHLEAMQGLEASTQRFCHDPINIATYKDFLIKKFYDGLVEQARQIFELTRLDSEHWVRGALRPLTTSIKEREVMMLKRVENLSALKDSLSTVQERLRHLDQQRQNLKKQGDLLDQLRVNLTLATPAGPQR